MSRLYIEEKHLKLLKSILSNLYPKSVIWAYGSRIKGSAHEGSDLDLVIIDYGTDNGDYLLIKETLLESNIPFLIDIFELKRLPESFKKEIKEDHVVLYDGSTPE